MHVFTLELMKDAKIACNTFLVVVSLMTPQA